MRIRVFKGLIAIAVSLISVAGLQLSMANSAAAAGVIEGQILAKYQSVAGSSSLGPAKYDALEFAPRTGLIGEWQEFAKGNIYSSPQTGTHVVWNPELLAAYMSNCGFFCYGIPIADEKAGGRNSRVLQLQQGNFYWSATTGAHGLTKSLGILNKYSSLGGSYSSLGLPVSDELNTSDSSGHYVNFQNGSIVTSDSTGAHIVKGAIRARWNQEDGASGDLGLPTSDEFSIPGGKRSNFEGGFIKWNSSVNQTTVVVF